MVDEAIRTLPKVQLHCHLEGTVRAETFRDLAAAAGLAVPRAVGPLAETYAFTTFREFLLTFADVCKTLRAPDDYARIAKDFVKAATEQNVPYAEVFVSPSVWAFFHPDLDVRACVAAMHDVFTAARNRLGIEVAFICDLTRNFGPARAFETARVAVALAEAGLGVIGVGLGGDEANFPPAPYADAFAFARAHGLRTVAHAGEAAGPQSVRDALDLLGAERIGHGVRAVEDPGLVALLAERGIALEICPTSNHRTGVVAVDDVHPLVALDAAGVRCVLDADDPALFSTTVQREYALAAAWLGENALRRLARNAIVASFASAERKSELLATLAASDLHTPVAARRS